MSGVSLVRILSSFAAVIFFLPLAPAIAVAQEDDDDVDCETVCRVFPDRAPPECGCDVQVGGLEVPGGDGGYADAAVRELHERVQESWREMTADVEDYTVVQTASVMTENGPMQMGPPVVMHYEKEWIQGYPMYRFVSPAELSNREQVASGEPTAGQVGGAMSQAIGLIGGAIAGAASEEGVGAGEAGESAGGFTLPRAWSDELAELGQLMNNLDEAAVAQTREDLADELLARNQLWRLGEEEISGSCVDLLLGLLWSAHYLGVTDPANPPPEAAEQLQLPWELSFDYCTSVSVSGSNEAVAQAWRDLGDGDEFEGYELVEAWWVLGVFYVTHASVHEIGMMAKLVSPSGESFVVSRVDSNHAPDAPFVPQRQSAIMSGLGDAVQAIQGFAEDLYVVIHEIRAVLVNEGAPTREEIAELLAEFAGDATGAGFPDS